MPARWNTEHQNFKVFQFYNKWTNASKRYVYKIVSFCVHYRSNSSSSSSSWVSGARTVIFIAIEFDLIIWYILNHLAHHSLNGILMAIYRTSKQYVFKNIFNQFIDQKWTCSVPNMFSIYMYIPMFNFNLILILRKSPAVHNLSIQVVSLRSYVTSRQIELKKNILSKKKSYLRSEITTKFVFFNVCCVTKIPTKYKNLKLKLKMTLKLKL